MVNNGGLVGVMLLSIEPVLSVDVKIDAKGAYCKELCV